MRVRQLVFTTLIASLMLLSLMPIAFAATAPEGGIPDPSIFVDKVVLTGTATIDGLVGDEEWDLTEGGAHYVAPMYVGWNQGGNKPILADVYMQYDCQNQVMDVLVLSRASLPVLQDMTTTWIAVGTSNDKVTFTHFAWVLSSTDPSIAVGWEASFPLAVGSLVLVHNNVWDGVTWQTAGLSEWLRIFYECPPPTSVTLVSLEAQGTARSIVLTWETASELDNLGFNLYRAGSAKGPWTRLNTSMIPSLVPPGSPTGAVYTYQDSSVQAGITYYYRLEDVDIYGQGEFHGPVSAIIKPLRSTVVRPRPDAAQIQK